MDTLIPRTCTVYTNKPLFPNNLVCFIQTEMHIVLHCDLASLFLLNTILLKNIAKL